MIFDVLDKYGEKSAAKFVEHGYGQVEPNHLSAQRTGQIYAQLPADASIEKLENGQFVKYDYAKGVVDFDGDAKGEWMLVFNEIKLYRENQLDCEFVMRKSDYNARVYSPLDFETLNRDGQSRYYNGVDADGNTSITINENTYDYDKVTAGNDMYELHYNENPFHVEGRYRAKKMPEGTKMVPRVFKTNVGDIYTTNCIDVAKEDLTVGTCLAPNPGTGYLTNETEVLNNSLMEWVVVKVYTMPDGQIGAKIMRTA